MPPDRPARRPNAPAARVLASGLNNPRHLVFRGGTLYVAEAGKGGTRTCDTGPEGGTVCYGATGSIMRLGKHPRRILTGLPSIGDQGTGGSALGPSGIVALGGGRLAVHDRRRRHPCSPRDLAGVGPQDRHAGGGLARSGSTCAGR